jgi:hypothetical protein
MEIEDSSYVDLTPFIWTLIRNVITLSYDDVKETPEFVKVYELIQEDDKTYYVTIDNVTISSEDLNDLFQQILRYLQIKSNDESYREMFIIFKKAMEIILTHGEADDLASILQNVSV